MPWVREKNKERVLAQGEKEREMGGLVGRNKGRLTWESKRQKELAWWTEKGGKRERKRERRRIDGEGRVRLGFKKRKKGEERGRG